MSFFKKAVTGAGILFFSSIITAFLAYLIRLLLAKNLSPEDFGLFYAMASVIGFFAVFQHIGLGTALLKFIPEYIEKKEWAKIKSAILMVITTWIIIASMITVGIILFNDVLAEKLFHDANAASYILVYSILVVFTSLDKIFYVVFSAFQKYTFSGTMNVIRSAFIILFAFIFIRLGFGILAPIYAYILANSLPLIFYYKYFFLKTIPSFHKVKATFSKKMYKKLLFFGIPILFVGFADMIFAHTDIILLTFYRSLNEVALYNAALPTSQILVRLSTSISAVLLPMSAHLWFKNDLSRLRAGMHIIYKYSLLIILPFIFVMFAFPNVVLRLLFGEFYTGASSVLRVLLAGTIFFTLSQINNTFLIAIGKPKFVSKVMISAALFNLGLNFIIIPLWGILGAGIATACSYCFIFLMSVHAMRKKISHIFQFNVSLRILLSSSLFMISMFVLKNILHLNAYLELSISAFVSGGIYALLLFGMRIVTIEEISDLFTRTVMERFRK